MYYKNIEIEELDEFNNKLKVNDPRREFDIVRVYRGYGVSFLSYEEEWPYYEAEDIDEEYEKVEEKKIAEPQVVVEEKKNDHYIDIVIQAYYGNRVITSVHKDNLDSLL